MFFLRVCDDKSPNHSLDLQLAITVLQMWSVLSFPTVSHIPRVPYRYLATCYAPHSMRFLRFPYMQPAHALPICMRM